MRELTKEEVMDLLCAPEAIDEPEEMDFYHDGFDDEAEDDFIDEWIEKELN